MRGPLLGCWQLTISLAQIIAAVINRGTESMTSTGVRYTSSYQSKCLQVD